MCCASCANKLYLNEHYRNCKLGEKKVPPTYLCKNWKMEKCLERVGKGNGMVRKPDWFRYLSECAKGRSIEDVTAEYEEKRGSKFFM